MNKKQDTALEARKLIQQALELANTLTTGDNELALKLRDAKEIADRITGINERTK